MSPLMALGLVGVLLPTSATAQGLVPAEQFERPKTQILLGGGATVALPVGEFRDFVNVGGGLNAFGVFNFDRNGIVGLRVDGSILWYGSETTRQPLLPRIDVDVTTDNFITSVGFGPQLTLGTGPVRPYIYGTVGFSYFATVSRVRGADDYGDFASTTNFDDHTFAAAFGGGLLVRLSRGRTPVYLDLNAYTLQNGEARYLREGSIIDRPDGSILFAPIESEANLVGFRLGVSVGVF